MLFVVVVLYLSYRIIIIHKYTYFKLQTLLFPKSSKLMVKYSLFPFSVPSFSGIPSLHKLRESPEETPSHDRKPFLYLL